MEPMDHQHSHIMAATLTPAQIHAQADYCETETGTPRVSADPGRLLLTERLSTARDTLLLPRAFPIFAYGLTVTGT